ncbi:MAG: slipin family protein [Phycisphaerae bacterium]|nr:slipin family protein [Phycisphaerae bacterium]
MANKNKAQPALVSQYKTTIQLGAEAASLNWVAVLAAVFVLSVGCIINRLVTGYWDRLDGYGVVPTVLLAAICLFGIKIADQWERAVLLRLGRFKCLKGPGPFFIIPIIDTIAKSVDMRIRSTDFNSESTLTKDTVPVNVDAICFWMVWDAKKAILEVEDFYLAIVLSAQTALRDIIGTHQLTELLSQREDLGNKLQAILDEKTNPWGITIQSVEIRDIILPKALEDAMSKEAQAERERHARVILGTAETEIAKKFVEAAEQYESCPGAMHLRGMNMLFEGLKERGSMIIVPSSALETMNLGAIGGLAAATQVRDNGSQKTEP